MSSDSASDSDSDSSSVINFGADDSRHCTFICGTAGISEKHDGGLPHLLELKNPIHPTHLYCQTVVVPSNFDGDLNQCPHCIALETKRQKYEQRLNMQPKTCKCGKNAVTKQLLQGAQQNHWLWLSDAKYNPLLKLSERAAILKKKVSEGTAIVFNQRKFDNMQEFVCRGCRRKNKIRQIRKAKKAHTKMLATLKRKNAPVTLVSKPVAKRPASQPKPQRQPSS